MNGVGVFFNYSLDLSRFEKLAKEGKINWIAPLMAPDQDSVQYNRKVWGQWRSRLEPYNVRMLAWLACDNIGDGNPNEIMELTRWLDSRYNPDGYVFNCEKAFESTNSWKGGVLCRNLREATEIMRKPKILSMPSTPAERYQMDYRAFAQGGFYFAPQAYWKDPLIPGNPTPKVLFDSIYRPNQIHFQWQYRLRLTNEPGIRWCLMLWPEGKYCQILDLKTSRSYKWIPAFKRDGDFFYMQATDRTVYDQTGKNKVGKLLGFRPYDKICPTVGVYESCPATPEEIYKELSAIKNLRGASLYLGDTSTSEHIEAVWQALAN